MPIMMIKKLLLSLSRPTVLVKFLIICGVFFCFSPSTYASCTVNTTSLSKVFTINAANVSANADITFSGTITCLQPQPNCTILGFINICPTTKANVSPYTCAKVVYDGVTSSVNNQRLAYQLVNLSVGGVTRSTAINTDTWYGPANTVSSGTQVPYSITFRIPANSNILRAYPTGIYQGTFHLYLDMQDGSNACEGAAGGGWDYADLTLTYALTMPSYCQLNTTSTMDFGTISDINTASQNYDATSAISSVCNINTPYTLYLSSGNNSLAGNRRMANGGAYIPYQLYKSAPSSSAEVWDETGGVSTLGGSGGVPLTGTGYIQTTTVYGRIAKGTAIPGTTGTYTDTVIVTLTY